MTVKTNWIFKASLIVGVIVNVAAIQESNNDNEYKNLQVLPKDISSKELQGIMVDYFQDGLGVGCGYCHAQEPNSIHLDYASDDKPEKKIARAMMRMTMEINKNYFGIEKPMIGGNTLVISCPSCHHGTAHPEEF